MKVGLPTRHCIFCCYKIIDFLCKKTLISHTVEPLNAELIVRAAFKEGIYSFCMNALRGQKMYVNIKRKNSMEKVERDVNAIIYSVRSAYHL